MEHGEEIPLAYIFKAENWTYHIVQSENGTYFLSSNINDAFVCRIEKKQQQQNMYSNRKENHTNPLQKCLTDQIPDVQ